MKQSTKLLSMLLAFLIAFSCLSVIGSAALTKNEIEYDCIDDAALTYKQVATLALDKLNIHSRQKTCLFRTILPVNA